MYSNRTVRLNIHENHFQIVLVATAFKFQFCNQQMKAKLIVQTLFQSGAVEFLSTKVTIRSSSHTID